MSTKKLFQPLAGPVGLGGDGVQMDEGSGYPESGPLGTGAGTAGPGSLYIDRDTGAMFTNEGTITSPYWSPAGAHQPGMIHVSAPSFGGSSGHTLADTGTSTVINPSGFTVLGDGIHETDASALADQATDEAGQTPMRLTTSNATGDIVAITFPIVAAAGPFQPDSNGLGVLDFTFTNVSALTTRIVGGGFVGLCPVGFTDPVTGATTVTTLVDNDLALMYMASTATDADRIIAAFNKANAQATQDYSVLTALNTGVNVPAALTYQRWRVEIGADGDMRGFLDKVQVFSEPIALEVDQEANPVIYISPTTTTIVSIDVARAEFFTARP